MTGKMDCSDQHGSRTLLVWWAWWMAAIHVHMIHPVLARELYVSPKGHDATNCGTNMKSPCASIRHTIGLSQLHDVIYIDGSKGPYYTEGASNHTLISHTLTLTSWPGYQNPVVDCRGNHTTYKLYSVRGSNSDSLRKYDVSLVINNITIRNCVAAKSSIGEGVVTFSNAEIKVKDSTFVNNGMLFYQTWYPSQVCSSVRLFVDKTMFTSNQHQAPMQPAISMVGCDSTDLTIHNSQLTDSPVQVHANKQIQASLQNLMVNGPGTPSALIDVTLANTINEIILTDCIIQNHSSSSASAFTVALNEEPIQPPNVHMTNVSFTNNHLRGESPLGGALSVLSRFPEDNPLAINLQLQGCRFRNNFASDAGGAIYITNVASVKFTSCTFELNQGTNGGAIYSTGASNLSFTHSTFKQNFANPQQYHQDLTTGGAIYIQQGHIIINNCSFLGNLASYKGSALYVENPKFLFIQLSYFESQGKEIKSQMRSNYTESLVHVVTQNYDSPSQIQILYTTFNSTAGDSIAGDSVINLKGGVHLRENIFECPTGHNSLTQTNKSPNKYDMYSFGHYRFSCHQCPPGTYSLASGSLNQTNHTIIKDITCKPCPPGGSCYNGHVVALPHYWGKVVDDNDNIEFFLCPKDFCCQTEPCDSYNACSNNRSGKLCSQCRDNFTFTMSQSSVQCIPEKECSSHALIPVLVIICPLVYILFFLCMPIMEASFTHFKHQVNDITARIWTKIHPVYEDPDETSPMLIGGGDGANYGSMNNENDIQGPSLRPNENEDPQMDEALEPAKYYPQNNVTITAFLKIWFFFYQMLPLVYNLQGYTFQGADEFADVMANIFYLHPIFSGFQNLCFSLGTTFYDKLLFLMLPSILPLSMAIVLFPISYAIFTPRKVKYYFSGLFGFLILFTYTPTIWTTLNFLVCSQADHESLMFYDATVHCYQPWQAAFWGYFVIFLVPQCLVLYSGLNLLRACKISLLHFVFACLIPLPFLLFWLGKFGVACLKYEIDTEFGVNLSTRHALHIFQSTFKVTEVKDKVKSYQFWDAVLSLWRLLLVTCSVLLIPLPVIRSYILFFFTVVVLGSHSIHWPYKSHTANILESFHLCILSILAAVNIVVSSLYLTAVTPSDNISVLFIISDWLYVVMLLLLPVLVAIIILLVIISFIKGVFSACCRANRAT